MKIGIILGTRPEILKLAPVIKECEKKRLDCFVIHTGQHYSYNLDKIFFEELNLHQAKYNLEIGSHSYGKQINLMINKIKEKLILEKPDVVLVQGDTNTVLSGTLAAHDLGIKIGHVEAGLRSHQVMIEEFNRVLTDVYTDFYFAPTYISKNNLIEEGINKNKVFVVGNTIVDALYENIKLNKNDVLNKLDLEKNSYILMTLHRQECVDNKESLVNVFDGLKLVHENFKIPIVFPMHPRTKNKINEFKLNIPKGMIEIEPQGYFEFLELMNNAKLVLTDSGGVQEETCILKVPCVTLREGTERPETLETGGNLLAGYDKNKILECSKKMINKERNWRNPFGDGKSAERIIEIITKNFKS